ncbi:3-dehydroquinate synthase [Ferruginibacter lapsinanis]|uniref:3-dehydroquinate synthase n=1 Tax=Ferruginibacter lapsinanis TaxID=563172 RepID=UPI001E58E1B9|nr:3-dehydroquinate synthase [Ferruginibacter lapsinanis]UEG49143.1 3-dehydroquinate synthase [Ferruginibacter lapsinanis]
MQTTNVTIGNKQVNYYFDANFSFLENITSKNNTIIITDDNVFKSHSVKFDGWKTVVIKAGEEHKQQSTVDFIISELIRLGADRKTFIVGVGGGVVTDITGYAASVYMRGLKFGFVPTTILAMVDASIGGKNGVDVGVYKNLVGLIKQPDFLLFDYSLLQTLPQTQWVNGFAEVIKHACIKDAAMFDLLENTTLENLQKDKAALAALIERNVNIKTNVVIHDEFEQGDRKLLNYGHTLGHAIENIYELLHGHAISIGMIAAGAISEEINNFYSEDLERVKKLLAQYHLPTQMEYDKAKIWEVLKLDKKKVSNEMNFVLLNKIGDATVRAIPMTQLEQLIK